MKLSSALVALVLPAAATAQQGRILNCNFFKTFGSGQGLSASGAVDFTVKAGADVTCYVDCRSGGVPQTDVAYNFGSAPLSTASVGNTATDSGPGCGNIKTTFTATEDQTQLGWSINAPQNYDKIVMGCYCTDDGTDFTINNIEATIENVESQIEQYISDVQEAHENGDLGCFSESALVQVRGKGAVAMKDLKLGDKVLTDRNTYQPVYSFGHRKPDFAMEFHQIYTAGAEEPLEMTGNHMIMVVDSKKRTTKAIRADRLQVGDMLLEVDTQEMVEVTDVKTAKKTGLYMPLTPNGQIVVNGILASNYISIEDEAPGVVAHTNWFFTYLSMPEQKLSHWWLSPFRMLCMGVSSSYCSNGDEALTAHLKADEDKGILPWLITGRGLAEVAELQHSLIQVAVFGFPTFLVFGTFNLMETVLLGPSVAPTLFVFLVAIAMVIKKKKGKKEAEESDLNEKLLVV